LERLTGLKDTLKRPDQPHDRRPVKAILAAEAVDHLHPRLTRLAVPHVMRELQIPDRAAVLRAPLRPPQVHT